MCACSVVMLTVGKVVLTRGGDVVFIVGKIWMFGFEVVMLNSVIVFGVSETALTGGEVE